MDFELEPQPLPTQDDRAWRRSLVLLAVLIALVVLAQIFTAAAKRKSSSTDSARKSQSLASGDFYIKLGQVWPSGKTTSAAKSSYEYARPWPSAYRRLGVMQESYGKSGLSEFRKLDSREATRGVSKKEIAKLRREKAMWLQIFSRRKVATDEASRYVKEIDRLDLGPLKSIAKALLYWNSGQRARYSQELAASKASARVSVGMLILLAAVLILGGVVGFFAALFFLSNTAPRFATAPRLPLQSSMLMTSFIVYLASYIGLSGLVEFLSDAVGIAPVSKWSGVAYMALVGFAALAAFGLGLLTLVGRASILQQDWRQIGFRTTNAGRDVGLGILGFFASLPFVFAAMIVAVVLNMTIFKHVPTPEQPFDQIVSGGSKFEVTAVFLAASILAPIVEETFFRGALYSAFRTRLGVWPSVLISSAIFAVIHPLPGGFLPIGTLACVLALLRERSGSLLPGIVCHGVYNTVVILLAAIFY